MEKILVAIVISSKADWVIMEEASLLLDKFSIPHEARALSAHKTPTALSEYVKSAEKRGVELFIAAAGGAAHLPGSIAAQTHLPVLGVPMPSPIFNNGLDALLSMVQMPAGVPVATLAIGKPGAVNAGMLAASMLANKYPQYKQAITDYHHKQAQTILEHSHLKG